MKREYIMLLAGVLLTALSCHAQQQEIDRTTVKTLDVKRYMGRWYELARYDHSFERGLERCEAFYTLLPDGKIEVRNTGIREQPNHFHEYEIRRYIRKFEHYVFSRTQQKYYNSIQAMPLPYPLTLKHNRL